MKKNALNVSFKTRKEIAEELGISTRTLRRWLKQKEIHLPRTLLGPKEQKIIYDAVGKPDLKS